MGTRIGVDDVGSRQSLGRGGDWRGSDGTMSVNFIFILLGIMQLSPLQTLLLAVCSVLAQCRIQVVLAFIPEAPRSRLDGGGGRMTLRRFCARTMKY